MCLERNTFQVATVASEQGMVTLAAKNIVNADLTYD